MGWDYEHAKLGPHKNKNSRRRINKINFKNKLY